MVEVNIWSGEIPLGVLKMRGDKELRCHQEFVCG